MLNTKTIGKKIAEARKKTNTSQAQLAQRLSISPQAVGKWERGESLPDIITLNRLADMLGVDLNYFSENFPTSVSGEKIMEPAANPTASLQGKEKQHRDMSGWNWREADFAGADLARSSFNGSDLHQANFSGADLTGTSFTSSDLREANFDNANLTSCQFTTLEMSGASFNQSIMVKTNMSKSGLQSAKFRDIKWTDCKLTMCDLRKTVFENCQFNGVDFSKSDLRGLCLEGQTFSGVKFDNAALNEVSFKGSTLLDVSFRSPYALTNKYYRALKTICFEGARMDKLTYALLKSLEVNLESVEVI